MPAERLAGAASTAEAAELRKAGADQPKGKARRGLGAGEGKGRNCGTTAEELRKLIAPVRLSHPCPAVAAPGLVRLGPAENTRERTLPEPPTKRGPGAALIVAEPTKGDDTAQRPACAVLTHPSFDRPAVANPRRPGPKRGTLSLARARRLRELAAGDAEWADKPPRPAHDLMPELLHSAPARAGSDRAAGLVGDDAVIGEALALLDSRLRRPGAVFESPDRVRAFVALHLAACEREEFRVLYLTHQHALIAFELMSMGTLTQTSVYPREVARRALALNAGAVILAHNHPSGHPEPSRADEFLTASMKTSLALVDVRVLDHLIVGRLQVVSMAERGLM